MVGEMQVGLMPVQKDTFWNCILSHVRAISFRCFKTTAMTLHLARGVVHLIRGEEVVSASLFKREK